MIEKIVYTFNKEDKGGHFEIPFVVPYNIDIMELGMEIESTDGGKAVIDLGLKDIESIRGWSGGSKNNITITKEYSTPGYFHGEIKAGTWFFLLSVYQISDEGCKVNLTVNLKEKKFRWLKGDTHFHTLHSDGNSTIDKVSDLCREIGFDFLISTNHNTPTQNYNLPTDKYITLIPGMELTTYHGHAGMVGLKNPIDDYRCIKKEDVLKKFNKVKAKGGYVGLNHPFTDDNEGCDWKWGFDFPYDWVEIWNQQWSSMNQNSLDWWQGRLSKGEKIPIIGGTDIHKIMEYKTAGFPVTYVYTNSIDSSAILENMKKGRVYISSNVDGPTIDVKTENGSTLGETIKDRKVFIEITGLNKNDEIRIITNLGIEKKYNNTGKKTFNFVFEREEQSFVRIEISRNDEYSDKHRIVLLTNPIYFDD